MSAIRRVLLATDLREGAGVVACYPSTSAAASFGAALGSRTSSRADLIVLGAHGRRGGVSSLLGRPAEHVMRRSPVRVLVVR